MSADEVIERILNHAPPTTSRRHYNHSLRVDEMRGALETWGAFQPVGRCAMSPAPRFVLTVAIMAVVCAAVGMAIALLWGRAMSFKYNDERRQEDGAARLPRASDSRLPGRVVQVTSVWYVYYRGPRPSVKLPRRRSSRPICKKRPARAVSADQ